MCAVEFQEGKMWYEFTKHFVGDQRICPPLLGVSERRIQKQFNYIFDYILQTTYPINKVVVRAEYSVPARVDEGHYRCEIEFMENNKKYACAMVAGEMHYV